MINIQQQILGIVQVGPPYIHTDAVKQITFHFVSQQVLNLEVWVFNDKMNNHNNLLAKYVQVINQILEARPVLQIPLTTKIYTSFITQNKKYEFTLMLMELKKQLLQRYSDYAVIVSNNGFNTQCQLIIDPLPGT
jgi:hypothetical protein